MSKNIKAVPTAEYNAVIAIAYQYVEGLRVGSAQSVAQAFHKDAVMYGFTNGENSLQSFLQQQAEEGGEVG